MRFCRAKMEISMFLRTSHTSEGDGSQGLQSAPWARTLSEGGSMVSLHLLEQSCLGNPHYGTPQNSRYEQSLELRTRSTADHKPRFQGLIFIHHSLPCPPPLLGARPKALHMGGKLSTLVYTLSPRVPSLWGRLL